MSNYASGYKGADAWFNKVDFFDVFVSSAISGLTAGAGNAVNAGKQVGKAGLFLLKNKNLIKAGEIVLTSAIDITGEGFQPITGKQFGQRVATAVVVWGATEVLGEVLKNAPKVERAEAKVEGAVDNATLKTEQLDPVGEALAIDQSKTVEGIEGAAKTSNLWKVGSYKNLRGLEAGLDAHHVGQKALMKRFVPGYNASTAPSILVPKLGHTVGKGVVSRGTSGLTNIRQVLARDIFELRRVYGPQGISNSSLQRLIQMNKQMYPGAFIK